MSRLTPLFADAKTAASLLCMKRAEFLNLVEQGALPSPCRLNRWDVQELQSIMRGDKACGYEDTKW